MSLHTTGEDKPRAAILHFPRKRRGRPKIVRPSRDTRTPELIMKRLKQETAEALDLCLERGIITTEQHWCGIHLRWLYTLRHGAPGVRAVDPTHLGGSETRPDDPEWRTAREQEYADVMEKLSQSGHAALLMDLCIYNERPRFLSHPTAITEKRAEKNDRSIATLLEGLDILVQEWRN